MRRLLLAALMTVCPTGLWADASEVVFLDGFSGKLGPGWRWLREDPAAWRFANDALEIMVQPGRAHDVRNALVRPAPDRGRGVYAVEVTVTNTAPATNQFEQAGITWYVDGKPVVKIVKELVNREPCMILGGPKPADGKPAGPRKAIVPQPAARLRLVVRGDQYTGEFRTGEQGPFTVLGGGALPAPNNDQVSVQCYQGPPNEEHWFRFDDFRIERLAE